MVSATTQGAEKRVGAIRRLVALTKAECASGPVLVGVMRSRAHKAPVGSFAAFGEMAQCSTRGALGEGGAELILLHLPARSEEVAGRRLGDTLSEGPILIHD